MKKLVICSDESVIGGRIRTGLAEAVDSLAISLARDYEVTVVTEKGEHPFPLKDGRIFGVDYVLTGSPASAIGRIHPDILHSFGDPELLGRLWERPERSIYTIDRVEAVEGKRLSGYDAVTTVSESYAEEIRDRVPGVIGIPDGILTEVLDPSTGLLIPARYDASDLSGKKICKRRLCRDYGLDPEKPLFLYLGRMEREKGADLALTAAEKIVSLGGNALYIGTGSVDRKGLPAGCVRVNRMLPPLACISVLAGADFLLYPSRSEPCGLMPMTACRYGTVPVTTLAGGLKDNMEEEIAVIIHSDLEEALERCFASPPDPRAGMARDFSWKTRKRGYLALYEGESAWRN